MVFLGGYNWGEQGATNGPLPEASVTVTSGEPTLLSTTCPAGRTVVFQLAALERDLELLSPHSILDYPFETTRLTADSR